MGMPCAMCEAVREVQLIERAETVTVKGQTITFTACFYKCLTCGEEFETHMQMAKNLAAARQAGGIE